MGRGGRLVLFACFEGLVSEEELEVVVRAEVVDEVDGPRAWLDRETEQVAGAAGVVVDGHHGHLLAEWRGFHHVAVAGVDGEYVAVRRDGQAALAVQSAPLPTGAA